MKKYKLYALTEPDNVETIRYIGVTKNNLLVRLGQHLGKCEERKTRRDEWILKLDISPRIILLDSFETHKEALKAEKETITKFELKGIILYNEQSNFNRRNFNLKEVHQYDLKGNYIKSYKSAREAEALKLRVGDIWKAANKFKNVNTCGGFKWTYDKV